jgi:hypothetical protein
MKSKFSTISLILAAALLLSGCQNTAERSGTVVTTEQVSALETEQAAPETAEQSSSHETAQTSPETAEPEQAAPETAEADKSAADVTLNGEYDKSALQDFVYEYTETDADSFLDDGYGEYKELYCRARCLARLIQLGNDEFPTAYGVGMKNYDVYIDVVNENYPDSPDRYFYSGISYDSFYNALLKVFTKEAADGMLANASRTMREYDGVLWLADASATDDITIVKTEYAVTNATENSFKVLQTNYHADMNEQIEFDPENAENYELGYLTYAFVKTDNGWRAESMNLRESNGD